jgi:hypothetical protein
VPVISMAGFAHATAHIMIRQAVSEKVLRQRTFPCQSHISLTKIQSNLGKEI